MRKAAPTPRNHVARVLYASGKFRPQVVRSAKAYSRKTKHRQRPDPHA